MSIENKSLGGIVLEVKQIERNGVPVGIVEGYIATWDIDRGDYWGTKDQFVKGAFLDSINEHKAKNRQIRLKDHHGRTVGGFPIDGVFEDARGLYGVGEINLEVQQGKEAFSLAKQKVLVDFSIGFSVDDSTTDDQNELRTIRKAKIWEGSIVDEPMNPEANIVAVKKVDSFKDLPIASKDAEWDSEKAFENARIMSGGNDAFLYFNVEKRIHLQIADQKDGKFVVIPKAVDEVAEYLKSEEAIEAMSKSDIELAIKHLERYYAKMDVKSPFAEEEKQFFNVDEVKTFTQRQFENALAKSGSFSKEAAKFLVSQTTFKKGTDDNDDEEEHETGIVNQKILDELKSLSSLINKK